MNLHLPTWLIPDTEHAGAKLTSIAVTIVLAWLLQRAGFVLVWRAERWLSRAGHDRPAAKQRARTLGQTTRHLITSLVAAGALLHSLDVIGWDVKPLLVGASILGAALGFGAQYLVRDVIAGAFILIEDQFSVGDVIDVAGTVATVEDVTLRSTRLRDFRGRLLFVPNGEMRIVINQSRDWQRSLVDLPLAHDQDPAAALAAAESAVAELAADARFRDRWLEPPQVVGLERIGPDGVILRVTLRTAPGASGVEAAREARRLLLARIHEAGLRLVATSPATPPPGA